MNPQIKSKIKKFLLISFVTFAMFAFFVLIVDSLQFYLRTTGITVVDIQATETEIDDFLSTLNVPQSTLQAADFHEKFAIYAALQEYPNATFVFSTLEQRTGTVTMLDAADWEILQCENVRTVNFEQISQVGGISEEDLSFSLMIFSLNDQFNRFAFFPTFTWHKNANITNDVFGFTLDNSWRRDAGNANITVTGNFGNSTQTLRFHNGFSFGAELGTAYRLDGVRGTQFQGTAALFASPAETAETANRRIMLSYAHDNSFFNNRQIPLEMSNVFFVSQSRVANAQKLLEW
ncbi:MAG: hypothetical protein FWG64_07295 [Firmicutes bacterium]|nr:hypothetical protein [Bacillota bacterium]